MDIFCLIVIAVDYLFTTLAVVKSLETQESDGNDAGASYKEGQG